MERIEPQLKDLNIKFQGITKRIEAVPEEIVMTGKRIKEKERHLDQVLKDIERAREERQKLLVTGGKAEPVTRRIKDLWESCDLIEDEILGLKAKVRELHAEKEELLKERDICQDEIIRTRLIPLVEAYNKNAEAVSDVLKGILSLMDEYGLSFGDSRDGWGRFISPSSWIGLRIIPRLCCTGGEPKEDFFNITKIAIERQQQATQKAFNASNTPGPEA